MQKCGAIGALAALTTAVSGCASVIEGRSQQISVNTSPPGAECGFYREEGIRIAFDPRDTRPGAGREDQERHLDRLREAGLSATTYLNHSGVSGAAFVNIIGGIFTLGISTVIGAAVDSSNGSHNLYQSPVNMGMAPNATGTSEGPAVLPQTFSAAKPAQAWSQQVAAPAGVVSTPGEPTRQQTSVAATAVDPPPAQPANKPAVQISVAPPRAAGAWPVRAARDLSRLSGSLTIR